MTLDTLNKLQPYTKSLISICISMTKRGEKIPEILAVQLTDALLSEGAFIEEIYNALRNDPKHCRGHESVDGPAGIAVYCDGSCRS